jgi:CheY-like chemotaxis protein
VRRIRQRRPVTAIALSGLGTEADLERSKDAGFSTHLTKPIDPRRLGEVIDELTSDAN